VNIHHYHAVNVSENKEIWSRNEMKGNEMEKGRKRGEMNHFVGFLSFK